MDYIKEAQNALENFYSMHEGAGEQYVQSAIAAALIAIAERLDTLVEIAQYTEANEKRMVEERQALAYEYDAIATEGF